MLAPTLSRTILIASASLATAAHHGMLAGCRRSIAAIVTLLLAITFAMLQGLEWSAICCNSLRGSASATCTLVAAGFHGSHVVVGAATILLTSAFGLLATSTPVQSLAFELAVWY